MISKCQQEGDETTTFTVASEIRMFRTFNSQDIHLITAAHTSQSRLLIYEASDIRETVVELFKNFTTRFHGLRPAEARPWNPRRRVCPFVSSKLYLIVHMLRLLHPIRLITSSSVILSEHENTYRHVRIEQPSNCEHYDYPKE